MLSSGVHGKAMKVHLNGELGSSAIDMGEWALIVAGAGATFGVVEAEKTMRRTRIGASGQPKLAARRRV